MKGTVVLCDTLTSGSGPLLAGAVGTVMQGGNTDYAFSYPLPATIVGSVDSASVLQYINTTR